MQKRLIRHRIPMSTAPLICQICKESKSPNSGMIAELIRPSLLEFIKRKMPDIDSKAFICFEDLGEFRKDYVKEVLEDEIGELTALDQEVVESRNSMRFFRVTSLNSSKGNSRLASDLRPDRRIRRELEIFDHVWGGDPRLDRHQRHHARDTRVRPFSIYIAKSCPFLPGCGAGAGYHDESKPFRGARPIAGGK